MSDSYVARLDALSEIWQVWGRLGPALTEQQWTAPTRCPGWDVAALWAHHAAFPHAMITLPDAAEPGEPLTAVDILRRFNEPGGVAQTMGRTVADAAVEEATRLGRDELVARFATVGPRVVTMLRDTAPDRRVPWPASGGSTAVAEALRIVLLEATVHLLDVQRAVDLTPDVPDAALAETVRLLAEVAPPIEFVEAASGRSPVSPLPVVR